MSDSIPCIGIDFGTTNSSMAWYNPRTGAAEIILNAEGEAKTPSLVYFGENETLVGKPVEDQIENVSADRVLREEVSERIVPSIKRNLLSPPRITLPGGRYIRPVEVVGEILKKLKRDAEEEHFHDEVSRVVITCPAEFDVLQRRKIEEAGRLAGFREVVLLEEPAAAALAYARSGIKVGRHVLVYDLGGGTFDLAVLVNEGESFYLAMEPKGIERCGGEDFDRALYYHCEAIARGNLGRPISLMGEVDPKFLRMCRQRKENLSLQEKARFSDYLPSDNGPIRFEHEVDRRTFEELIKEYVETTAQLTGEIVEQANARGHQVETAVLIGGSSRVPLVDRMLSETVPVKPLKFDKKDVAVALGAAYYADSQWPSGRVGDDSVTQYLRAVEMVWVDGELDKEEVEQLGALAGELRLSGDQISEIEREVMGAAKEEVFNRRGSSSPPPPLPGPSSAPPPSRSEPPPPASSSPPPPPSGSGRSRVVLWIGSGAVLALIVVVASVVGFASQSPSPSPSPPPSPSPSPPPSPFASTASSVIFRDDFSTGGWSYEPYPGGADVGYWSGGYWMTVPPGTPSISESAPVDQSRVEDASVEVDASNTGNTGNAPDSSHQGVVCRRLDPDNFYALGVNPNTGPIIVKIEDGQASVLAEDGPSNTIKKGTATNRIRGDCAGSMLTLYVNGQKLLETSDTGLSSGQVGLYAHSGGEPPGNDVLFDNFLVSKP